MIDYTTLPENLRAGMRRYIEDGIETGGFLRAVLESNLSQMLMRADNRSRGAMREILDFVRHAVPEEARGSHEKVAAWIAKHAEALKKAGARD